LAGWVVLVAGVFVFWGLLIQQRLESSLIGIGSLLIALLMPAWILFAHHYRQL
jgi:hypothetical protein